MKHYLRGIALPMLITLSLAPAAWADNVAHCEALIMQNVPNADGTGEAQIVSYRPAVDFLASLYDEDIGHMTEIAGFPIRAIMCRRNDVIPAESDYRIIAAGVPFILSQDFDRTDTDSLTIFWKDDALDYVYKGYPLPEEAQAELDARITDFTQRGKAELPPSEEKRDGTQNDDRESDDGESRSDVEDETPKLGTSATETFETEAPAPDTSKTETPEIETSEPEALEPETSEAQTLETDTPEIKTPETEK